MATSPIKKSRPRRFFSGLKNVITFPFTLVKTLILPGKAIATVIGVSEERKNTIRKRINITYWVGLIGAYMFAPTIFTQTIPRAFGGPVANFFTTTIPNAFTGPVANFFTSTIPNAFTGPVAGVFTSTIPGTFMGLASTVGSYSLPLVGTLGLTGGIVVVAIAAVAAVAIAAVFGVALYKGAKALWRGLKSLFKSKSDENAHENDLSNENDMAVELDEFDSEENYDLEFSSDVNLMSGISQALSADASPSMTAAARIPLVPPVPRAKTDFEEKMDEIQEQYENCLSTINDLKGKRPSILSFRDWLESRQELKEEQSKLKHLASIQKVFKNASGNPKKEAAALKELERRVTKFEEQEERAEKKLNEKIRKKEESLIKKEQKNAEKSLKKLEQQEAKAQKELENGPKPSLKQRVSEATKGFREGATQLFKQGVTAIKSVLSKAANLIARVAAKISSVVKAIVAGNQASTQNRVSAEQVIQPKGTARPLPATPAATGTARPLPPTPTATGTARPLPPIPTKAVISARNPLPPTPTGAIKKLSARDAFLRKSQNGQQKHTNTEVKKIRERAEQRREKVAELDRRVAEKMQMQGGSALSLNNPD